MDTARPGVGTRWFRGDGGSPETFEEILGVMDGGAPRSVASEALNTTDMRVLVDENGFETFVNNGVKKQKPITVKIQYLPGDAIQEKVRSDVGVAGAGGNYRCEIPTVPTKTWTGAAIVTRFEVQPINLEGLIEAEFDLQPSGEWTLA